MPTGVKPRRTAQRRDRMLGVADYVHLSLAPSMPLLRDKTAKGYPHAVLVFRAEAILLMPEVALLPYNTKAWKSKADESPVLDPAEQGELLRDYFASGRLPSLEVLVKYGLPLDHLANAIFRTEQEGSMVESVLASCGCDVPPVEIDAAVFGPASADVAHTWPLTEAYFDQCREAGRILPPPSIEFD